MSGEAISTLGVVGSDGVVPIYDPEARWCWWSLDEIYLGTEGSRKFIPKVNDYVMDHSSYTVYRVRHIDPVTLVASLVQIRPNGISYVIDERDALIGTGPGTQSDTYRIYIDTSVTPHTLAVDARLKVAGSMVKYCKIFRGADLSDSGDVITRVYDASQRYTGNIVNLERVAYNSHDNFAIFTVPVCYTLAELPDGEIVTAVFYDDAGHVVSKRQLLVENTAFIRQAYDEERYITAISMRSPFLSATYENLIEFPLNVPLTAMNLIGVVHYNDGSTLELPVDGSKFKIFGLDQYLSSIVGQKIQLVLSYALSPSESVYGATTGDGKYITQAFSLVTVEPNNAYTVKVFGYPEFVNLYEGYRMRWFMLNLDRNIFADVTSHVRFADNSGGFRPTGYGYIQRHAISLKLSDVSGAYRNFMHTQVLDVLLRGKPEDYDTPWEVASESASDEALYGAGLKVERHYNFKERFTIHSGVEAYSTWLDRVYRNTYPLINRLTEIEIPLPTHFELRYQERTMRYEMQDWNKELSLGVVPMLGSNVYIRFIKVAGSGDLTLSVAAMVVKS